MNGKPDFFKKMINAFLVKMDVLLQVRMADVLPYSGFYLRGLNLCEFCKESQVSKF